MARLTANPKLANTNGWQDRHNRAVAAAVHGTENRPMESPLARMLDAWAEYAGPQSSV